VPTPGLTPSPTFPVGKGIPRVQFLVAERDVCSGSPSVPLKVGFWFGGSGGLTFVLHGLINFGNM